MDNFLVIKRGRNVILRCLFIFLALFSVSVCFAQEDKISANEDMMRSNGKIYVVMAVCLTILIGLIAYAIRIDRKIKKIEDGK